MARYCLCHLEPNPRRENSAEFGREFKLSLKDMKSFYNKYLVWQCWQSGANLSLHAIREMQGDLPICRDGAV